MKSTPLFALFLAVLFTACGDTNDIQPFVGTWEGVSWEVQGQPSGRNAESVVFSFEEDHTYTARFGAQKEEGTFRVQAGKLYTTETGKAEKMVSYEIQEADTLQMTMNRMGDIEVLTLVRKP